MTTQELRELDAWIAEHVMGCKEAEVLRDLIEGRFIRNTDGEILIWRVRPNHPKIEAWQPTTDSSDAMDVLKKCAEKCFDDIVIHRIETGWEVGWVDWNAEERADVSRAETLELAICLFAKTLFSQTTK